MKVKQQVGLMLMWLTAPDILAASPELAQFSAAASKGNLSVWRIDQHTASVSLCSFEGHLNKPVCYPWSKEKLDGRFSIIPGDDVLSTWRLNDANGAVSLCEYKDVSEAPICTPWSTE